MQRNNVAVVCERRPADVSSGGAAVGADESGSISSEGGGGERGRSREGEVVESAEEVEIWNCG